MFSKRTDLALEAKEIWQESAEKTSRLSGVKAKKQTVAGYPVTRVEILNQEGETALGKPQGTYLTLDLSDYWARRDGFFERAARTVGQLLKPMLPESGAVLVVGLGNEAMTPDAIGPLTADSVLVTRHLIAAMPRHFSGFRPVAVCRTGVLGTTGIESADLIHFRSFRRCHDDRDVFIFLFGTQFIKYLQSIRFRHHNIQNDKLRKLAFQSRKHSTAVRKTSGGKPGLLQCVYFDFTDCTVVINAPNHTSTLLCERLKLYLMHYFDYNIPFIQLQCIFHSKAKRRFTPKRRLLISFS